MLETPEEMARLQDLLDSSMAAAGPHLRDIITERRRLRAPQLTERLQGMRLLVLATVTSDGRPLCGPVDGYFLHGTFWCSSGRDSVRMRHLAVRPAVSATHLPGEDLAVTVHGSAEIFGLDDPVSQELRQAMLDEYLPKQGPSFEKWLNDLDGLAAGGSSPRRCSPSTWPASAGPGGTWPPGPCGSRLLGGRLDRGDPPRREPPGLVVRRRVLVDHATGGRLVDPLHGQAQQLSGVLTAELGSRDGVLRAGCGARPGPTCCAAGASRSGGSALSGS